MQNALNLETMSEIGLVVLDYSVAKSLDVFGTFVYINVSKIRVLITALLYSAKNYSTFLYKIFVSWLN